MSGALLLAGVLLGPAEPSLPDGNSLVRELARKQRHWEEVLDSYTYDVEVLREELEKDGRVAKRRIRAYEVFYVKGRPVWRLVRDEGQPLDADRQAKVDRAVKEKVDAINEGRSAAELPGVRLSAILERETGGRVSVSSFVGLYLRLLRFPADVLSALDLDSKCLLLIEPMGHGIQQVEHGQHSRFVAQHRRRGQ